MSRPNIADSIRAEEATAATRAPRFKIVGHNIYTGNEWNLLTDLEARTDANVARRNASRLETDDAIEYHVEEQKATSAVTAVVHSHGSRFIIHVYEDGKHTGNTYAAADEAHRDELLATIRANA